MQISQAKLRAVARHAATNDVRHYLNGVLVDVLPNEIRLVATQGHRLAMARQPSPKGEAPNTPQKIIIPIDTVKALTKGAKDDIISIEPTSEHGEYIARVAGQKHKFKAVDGKFPDYLRVTPKGPPSGELARFNWAFADAFTQSGRDLLGKNGCCAATIHHNGENASLVTVGHDDFIGVVMPIRSTEASEVPSWASEVYKEIEMHTDQKKPPAHKATNAGTRRYYAEYHYDEGARSDPSTPWAAAIGEYSTDTHTNTSRANGDDE